jgi:hypothetical protein
MAAEKTTKRKRKAANSDEGGGSGMLRLRTAPRKERRYEPTTSTAAYISVLGMAIGSVLLGAGVYGQWLRASIRPEMTEPHPYAPYLLLAGAVLVLAVLLVGPRPVKPIRVGDAGLALEKEPSDIERIEWRDVSRILFGGDVLTFQSPGNVLAIPVKQHPQAAARALAEARERIPAKLQDVDSTGVPKLDPDEGEVLPLEAPQLAGARCKASDELIAFEKDARLCGRCGEVYHKSHVPDRCLTCDAALK